MLENFFLFLDDAHVGDNICSDSNALKALRFVGYILFIAKIIVPMIIVIFGSIDLAKSVIAGTTDSLTKQAKSIGFRILIGLLIFFLPTLINVVLSATPSFDEINGEYTSCKDCMLSPFSCKIGD